MKKAFIISFVTLSVSYGCHDQTSQDQSVKKDINAQLEAMDPKLKSWIGEYSGTTPCSTCSAFCPDCEGMGLKLIIKSNQTFELYRTSYSGNDSSQKYTGHFSFYDESKIKLEGLKERNIILLGESALEIINNTTQQPYEFYNDFKLIKTA